MGPKLSDEGNCEQRSDCEVDPLLVRRFHRPTDNQRCRDRRRDRPRGMQTRCEIHRANLDSGDGRRNRGDDGKCKRMPPRGEHDDRD